LSATVTSVELQKPTTVHKTEIPSFFSSTRSSERYCLQYTCKF